MAESENRPIYFGDLIPADCVLRRLAEELFLLASPTISTWRLHKGHMASEGSSWHEVRSEELPEGLSDRDGEDHSMDEAPSSQARRRVSSPRSFGLLGLTSQKLRMRTG